MTLFLSGIIAGIGLSLVIVSAMIAEPSPSELRAKEFLAFLLGGFACIVVGVACAVIL